MSLAASISSMTEAEALVDVELSPPAGGPESATAEPIAVELVAPRGWLVWIWWQFSSACETAFGLVCVVAALSILATIPLLNFLTLGYLLESSGRICRTGHWCDALVGTTKAARLGGMVLGTVVCLLPLWFVASVVTDARLIAPGSPADRGWTVALWIVTTLGVLHILSAWWRGGRLRHFLIPAPWVLWTVLCKRGASEQVRDGVYDFLVGLRLPYYFWLGLRGFVGGMIWLALPVSLLVAGREAPVVGLLGGMLLAVVLLYVPFLQTRFAAENRFAALFELRAVREWFRRAPLAFGLSLVVLLAAGLPLYLLKVEIVAREAAWLPSLVFVVFMLPGRWLLGAACASASCRTRRGHWLLRQLARLLMLPAAALFVFLVFFTQYTSWNGVGSLYEQHVVLLPVPFWGY